MVSPVRVLVALGWVALVATQAMAGVCTDYPNLAPGTEPPACATVGGDANCAECRPTRQDASGKWLCEWCIRCDAPYDINWKKARWPKSKCRKPGPGEVRCADHRIIKKSAMFPGVANCCVGGGFGSSLYCAICIEGQTYDHPTFTCIPDAAGTA